MILNCPECGQPHHVDDDDPHPHHAYCPRCVNEVTWSIVLDDLADVGLQIVEDREKQKQEGKTA